MLQSAFLRANVSIIKIERPGSLNRYGVPNMETIYRDVSGRLDQSTRFVRSVQGDLFNIDGSLFLDSRYVLKVKDVITIDNKDMDRWEVFDISEKLDVHGQVLFRKFGLTKQRKDS